MAKPLPMPQGAILFCSGSVRAHHLTITASFLDGELVQSCGDKRGLLETSGGGGPRGTEFVSGTNLAGYLLLGRIVS